MDKSEVLSEETDLFFFPLDISYTSNDNGLPQIRLFGITETGESVLVNDNNFSPYFYAIPEKNVEYGKLLEKIEELVSVKKTEVCNKFLMKNKVKAIKITVNKTTDVKLVKGIVDKFEEISSCQEADISFHKRYLIDKNIIPYTLCKASGHIQQSDLITLDAKSIETVNLNPPKHMSILGFDIETLSSGEFSDPNNDPIIMVSFYGSREFKKVITWKRFEGAPEYIQFVDGESDLIEAIVDTIKEFDPDILVGYGSDNFDWPYIQKRASKYNIKLTISKDNSEIRTNKNYKIKFKGIVNIDIYNFIRRILDLNTDNLKLDSVAKEFLGKNKLFQLDSPEKINEMWKVGLKEDMVLLTEYNLIDSQLAFELFEKILPTQLQLVKLLGMPLEDINLMSHGQVVEHYLMKKANEFGQLIPSIPNSFIMNERRKHAVKGGLVIEPKPGLYKNVFVFDFKASYPQIIIAHNISPEKKDCECCIGHGGYKIEELNTHFCSREPGFVPSVLKEVVERRNRIKKIIRETDKEDISYNLLNGRQKALKFISNSFYGYLGYAGSRWYSLNSAAAITFLGRKYIRMVVKEAEKFGFEVLYSDTDSVFVTSEEKSFKQVDDFLDIINAIIPKPMELEFQGYYSSGMFLSKKGDSDAGAKKRYALLKEDESLVLKGIEAVRGDWCILAKNLQKEVLHILLKEGDIAKAKSKVRDVVKNIETRNINLTDIIHSTRLTKNLDKYIAKGPHVTAGEMAKAKGKTIGRGSTVSYIIKPGEGSISSRVILAEDAKLEDYDPKYYIDHQIMRVVYKIFDIFNVAEEELKAGQTSLFNYGTE